RVIQSSRKFEEERSLLREDQPTKLLRPLPLLTHRLERKTLGLGHPPIVLPSFTLFSNRDFKQFRGMTVQRLVTDKLARDLSLHLLSDRQQMIGRNRNLEVLPPLREDEPRML